MKMKNGKKLFFLTEAALGLLVLATVILMLQEQNGRNTPRISVILQNAQDSQWAAFRYGLKMAAQDQEVELSVAGTEGILTAQEQADIIESEVAFGADAVIVQPARGMEEILKKISRKVPVILVEDTLEEAKKAELAVIQPDQYEMGKVLAEELLKDYAGGVEGKRIGIYRESMDSPAEQQRKKGFEDELKEAGALIVWDTSAKQQQQTGESLEDLPEVDFVMGMNDDALVRAGETAANGNLHGALVYGIGNSTEAVYYLDTGIVERLVVPDEFQAGYQSLTESAESLRSYFYKPQDCEVSCTVLTRDTLFSKENQEILFTMSQG